MICTSFVRFMSDGEETGTNRDGRTIRSNPNTTHESTLVLDRGMECCVCNRRQCREVE
jgi:hypothetical protein